MQYSVAATPALIHSLAGLSLLRSLTISLDGLPAHGLIPLTSLVHLEKLTLSSDDKQMLSMLDASPLFTLTALTSLELAEAAWPPSDASPADTAAVGLLSKLTNLTSLRLPHCGIDDTAFNAIRHLCQLTTLSVASIALSHPTGPGHLPHLEELSIDGDFEMVRPSQVLSALLPFLPLANLREHNEGMLELDLSHNGVANGGIELAALHSALRHLGAAPHLLYNCVSLLGNGDGDDHLPLRQAVSCLAPLRGQVTSLILSDLEVNVGDWIALGAALPALDCLHVMECDLVEEGVAPILSHLSGLTSLHLEQCTEGLALGAWAEVGIVCAKPMLMIVDPRPSNACVTQCVFMQESVYGQQHITWQ